MALWNFIKKHSRWLLPLIALLLIAPFTPYLDLKISGWFYRDGGFPADAYAKFFYYWGFYPAEIVAVVSLLLLIASIFFISLKPFRRDLTLLVLTLAIGSGLIVHGILKDHWGRPRPVQITEFGGQQQFRPFYDPDFSLTTHFKSFPCGHGSVGFYFFALMLIAQRRHLKSLEFIALGLALFLGFSLSYARIAMGGHFFSDALVSALIMWWTALSLNWLLYRRSFNEGIN